MCAQKSSLDFLKETNDWLEEYPISISDSFDNMVGKGKKVAQSKIDIICEWMAWKVNVAIERKRQQLLKCLHEMYETTALGKVMKAGMAVDKFVKDPLGAVGSFADAIFGPVKEILKWVGTLATELPRLARNLADIANTLPPSPIDPTVNYDKFKLKIGTISMGAITQDPSNLPTPEQMFPEPQRPWSAQAFQAEFDLAPKIEKKYFYNIKTDYEKNDNPNSDSIA